jgi:putative transposase
MKRHSVNEIVSILRKVGKLVAQGAPVAEAVQVADVTMVTFYRWRRKYDGLKDDQVDWLKSLQAENTQLRKAVADLALDKLVLAEASKEFLVNSAIRRACIDRVIATLNVSERRACQVLGQHRSTQRKAPKSVAKPFNAAEPFNNGAPMRAHPPALRVTGMGAVASRISGNSEA